MSTHNPPPSHQPNLDSLNSDEHSPHHPDQPQHHQQDGQATTPPDTSAPASAASPDSDELHETRPNRWRGHPSTWRAWTAADRQTWAALENARRADLAVHLYNAFGLRRGLRGGPEVEEGPRGEPWEPGKSWTAWPMRADEVPDDGLLPRTDDVNEPFTLRREQAPPFAGCNLEEEISAAMLRCAKERFRRTESRSTAAHEQALPSVEGGDAGATDGETDAGTAADDDTDAPRTTPRRRRRAASPAYTPVVAADDERSYALLRPEARRVMARLDDTLMILHNQRAAGLRNMSESSASDDDETDRGGLSQASSRAPTPTPPPPPPPPPPPRATRRGRPKKVHVPRDGETEQEMLIRLAREGKRKLPVFSSGTEGESPRKSRSRSRSRSKNARGPRSASASSRASSLSQAESRGSSVSSEMNKEKLLGRWGLRDWRDVLGAAALAGFSPEVIARATQRCATLFREEMTMHTMHGQPGTAGVETALYVPDGSLPPSSDEEYDAEEGLVQLRTVSRQASARPGVSSPEPEAETPADRRSRSGTPAALRCPHPGCRRFSRGFTKKSNFERHLRAVHHNQPPEAAEAEVTEPETPSTRRSRSATPALAHFCPYPRCPRAVEGFAKRTNLTRHLREVHGRRGAAAAADVEDDTADEMDGGVHVDRFLQPIKIRKGWRGDATQQRPPKRARAASEELDSL